MNREIVTTSKTAELSPLEIELRDALGFIANLAARVELAKDLGEISGDAMDRINRIASHLGVAASRIGQSADAPTERPAPVDQSTNGHANGHGQNGHSINGHSLIHPTAPEQSNGHVDSGLNGKSHESHHKHDSRVHDEDKPGNDAELFVDIPELIKQSFSADEYKTFSERDIAVAMHLLEKRSTPTSVRELVDTVAPAAKVIDTAEYDVIRKGVSTSLKKLRSTELGQRCLRDNGQLTKARRYMLLTDEEAREYPVPQAQLAPEEDLSTEEQEALATEREKLFAGFIPIIEENPQGNTPCIVLSDTKLQVGNQVYEYQLTGKRAGNKNTTVGMYNGLVELLVKQGKTEIKPSELTELLGLHGSGAVGRAFDNLTKRFDVFPFVRTGTARATRYFRNPDFYFTNAGADSDNDAPSQTPVSEKLTPESEIEPVIEVPELPKQLELCDWRLNATIDQEESGDFTTYLSVDGKELKLRDITIQTLLVLVSSRQSILQSDLFKSMVTLHPDLTEEQLRGCLHEIRNSFEYHNIDKHLYIKQMPEREGREDTLLNVNGIVDQNGVADFLGLSSVID